MNIIKQINGHLINSITNNLYTTLKQTTSIDINRKSNSVHKSSVRALRPPDYKEFSYSYLIEITKRIKKKKRDTGLPDPPHGGPSALIVLLPSFPFLMSS